MSGTQAPDTALPEVLDESAVAAYLRAHADFFQRHPALLAELGTYYLSTGRTAEGTQLLRDALDRGLDSATISRILERYPDLEL